MDTVDEGKLRKEIQYLTRLIEAHKAIKEFKGKHSKSASSKATEASTYRWRNKGVSVPSWTNPGSISSYQLSGSNLLAEREKEASPQHWDASCTSVTDTCTSKSTAPQRIVVISDSHDSQLHTKKATSLQNIGPPRTGSNGSGGRKGGRVQATHQGRRKRTASSSGSRECKKKRRKLSLQGGGSSSQSKYVWKANASKTSSDKTQPPRHIPDHTKLRWRQEPGLCSHSRNSRTALSTAERTDRGHSSMATGPAFSSPFVVKRYKLRRMSTLGRNCLTSTTATRSRLGSDSFSQRRLKYMIKHSPLQARKRRLSSHRKHLVPLACSRATGSGGPSVHRVWRPSSVDLTDQNQADGHMTSGSEVKTKGGNKQWLSANARKERKKAPSRRLSGHRRRQRLISISGSKYVLKPGGRSLQRLASSPVEVIGRASLSMTSCAKVQSPMIKQLLASNALQKSRNMVWTARKKDLESKSKSKQYCIYYNRFGRCSRGTKCSYVHDPARVAICSKFLRGTCDKTDGSCPFSHNVSKEKMPVCSYFIRGLCIREDCPYLHVRVNQDAAICTDFIRGLCPRGEKCTLQHVVDCPEFSRQGSCPRGKRCPLRHRQRTTMMSHHTKEEVVHKVPSVKEPYVFRKLRRKEENEVHSRASAINSTHAPITPAQLEFIPLDTSIVPEFIAL